MILEPQEVISESSVNVGEVLGEGQIVSLFMKGKMGGIATEGQSA